MLIMISLRRKKKAVEEAFKYTLPSKERQRNFLIFQLCRWLKGMEEFAELPVKVLKLIVREWHRLAEPTIGTKPFDDTWADFTYGWERVKYPKGEDMLKLATQKALKTKESLDVEKEYDSDEIKLLIKVCYQLQKLRGPEPFWLSCYSAGAILGLSHTEANKKIQMLVADGVIRQVKKNTTTKATRFRYVAN